MRIVALIPARAGSKRIPQKNTRLLGGKPLIQWTIEAAQQSGVFAENDIYVCTDDPLAESIARTRGAVPIMQGPPCHVDTCQDITWVSAALLPSFDAFAILRPTSPFRTAHTIRQAVEYFKNADCSSIRAMERAKQHPGKMWQSGPRGEMVPLIGEYWPDPPPLEPHRADVTPWHSRPTQSLPPVYVQNSSLEIAWRWCVDVFGTISGPKVGAFLTEGMEGFSIDYPEDWERAERYVAHLQEAAAAE